MAWPGSVAACQSRKTRQGGGVLQLGRGPDLSGFGSAALDVGRRSLLQNPSMQTRVRERAVPARTERGSSVRTATVWVIRTLSALGIKDFRSVLLGRLRGVTAPPIDHAEAV